MVNECIGVVVGELTARVQHMSNTKCLHAPEIHGIFTAAQDEVMCDQGLASDVVRRSKETRQTDTCKCPVLNAWATMNMQPSLCSRNDLTFCVLVDSWCRKEVYRCVRGALASTLARIRKGARCNDHRLDPPQLSPCALSCCFGATHPVAARLPQVAM
mmetsp:Transcript_15648/g.46972  ORF Transcript_15648/g.46972 Transcript_15648/m.46972 type:complete len:158 (-) Transcript_15648:216-689(-)